MQHCQEVDRVLLEAGRDTAEMLQLIYRAFDHVSLPVDALIERIHDASVLLWWNHRFSASGADVLAKRVTNIAAIGNNVARPQVCQECRRLGHIMNLACGDAQTQRQSLSVAQQMNLGAQSASGTPQRLVVFFLEPA